MGGLASKHMEDIFKAPGTPQNTHVLPGDPRSPSDYISRTPIAVTNTPDSSNDGTPRLKVLASDPRSPNTDVNRTPIVVETNTERRRPFHLKPSRLEQLESVSSTSNGSNDTENDPRSPTTKVPRTPLDEKEHVFDTEPITQNDSENSADQYSTEVEEAAASENMDDQEKSLVKKLFPCGGSTDKMRRPLTSVQNTASNNTPRGRLQAKQCKNVEEEYNKSQKVILDQLSQENTVVASSTQFVESI
ncbi:cell division cycle-associated protein 3-like isoform X2 [Homarus americanus]|uniref:Putative cell division cycle-associated protein 3-like n=2 Tax=Homarus americanus TaxID=6706 RepID=A0A8J5MWT0_HOMAM|nr:cell division cycle-associated protein 3-like isoform X2 [Homarus americanus]KAG7166521.1 putative cell division cycle-associated protein 3-like [Homarus americanus]